MVDHGFVELDSERLDVEEEGFMDIDENEDDISSSESDICVGSLKAETAGSSDNDDGVYEVTVVDGRIVDDDDDGTPAGDIDGDTKSSADIDDDDDDDDEDESNDIKLSSELVAGVVVDDELLFSDDDDDDDDNDNFCFCFDVRLCFGSLAFIACV